MYFNRTTLTNKWKKLKSELLSATDTIPVPVESVSDHCNNAMGLLKCTKAKKWNLLDIRRVEAALAET